MGLRGRSTGQGGPGPLVPARVALTRPLAGIVKTYTGSLVQTLVLTVPGPPVFDSLQSVSLGK